MGIGPIHLLAIMYFLLLFLHHDVRMYDFFYGPIVPEINYSSSSSLLGKQKSRSVSAVAALSSRRDDISNITIFPLQVSQFWLDDMYLKVQLPLPVNSNPGMVFPRQKFADHDAQLR